MCDAFPLASAITSRFGVVKRARNCFLYTAKGVRLTDMYQEEGRAILGWGGASAFTVLKNVLNRGITGSFDTDFSPRADGSPKSQLSQAVTKLLSSERIIAVVTSKQLALQTALRFAPDATSFFRPWTTAVDWSTVKCVIIAPPLPWASSHYILAFSPNCSPLLCSEPIPAPLCAAFTRSIYDLIKAIPQRQEKDWFIYDSILTRYWERRGPYLYPKVPQDRYPAFIEHCLEQTLVISPVYNQPSIVPFGADKGVFRALDRNPFV